MVELTPSQLRNALSDPIFVVLSTAADALQLPCYLIGGYVRDLFLKRESTDIDVVVVGHGIAMAKEVAKRLGRGAHISVFQRFGTAQVKWQGRELEFVGARREGY